MMKKHLLLAVLAAGITFTGCNNDEIDALNQRVADLEQGQTDLDGRISDVESDIAEQIAAINTSISELDASTAALLEGLSGELTELEDALALLSSDQDLTEEQLAELEAEFGKIYWGNVATDEEFAMVSEEGYELVSGYVNVTSDEQVAHLAGLVTVGGDLLVGKNVTDLSLPMLEKVIGEFYLADEAMTESVSAPMLEVVGLDLTLTESEALATIDLGSLNFVGGDLKVYGSTMSYVNNIESFNFNSLVSALSITVYAGVASFEFPALTYVAEDIYFDNWEVLDPASTTVYTFNMEALTKVGGTLSVRSMPVEGDFNFAALEEVGTLVLRSNRGMEALSFPALVETMGDIEISSNLITSIDFSALETIGGAFMYNSNGRNFEYADAGMTAMNDFHAVASVGGDITISNNSSLATIDVFSTLTSMAQPEQVGGGIGIGFGVASISDEMYDVEISGETLTSVEGFDMVEKGGGFTFDNRYGGDAVALVSVFNSATEMMRIIVRGERHINVLGGFEALETVRSTNGLESPNGLIYIAQGAYSPYYNTGDYEYQYLDTTPMSISTITAFANLTSIESYDLTSFGLAHNVAVSISLADANFDYASVFCGLMTNQALLIDPTYRVPFSTRMEFYADGAQVTPTCN